MAGFGSPCGACKFLRRKCVKGCIFAPYFCHEQAAAHFSAIHKVFGASNVSKLLKHLPVSDRSEAAATLSYEAQARLQDPIYGCVAHIFALQQQVLNLQAQLASLNAQATQTNINNGSSTSTTQQGKLFERFPCHQQGALSMHHLENAETMLHHDNGVIDTYTMGHHHHSTVAEESVSFTIHDDPPHAMASVDMEDLQSVAFAYLHQT